MLDWIVDCGYTPHLIVDATSDAVQVPRQFVKEGRIVLNIAASATQSFQIGAEAVEFNARFSGVGHRIHVPVDFVLGIYARETGQGMVFTDDPGGTTPGESGAGDDDRPPEPPAPAPERPKRPSLKVVK
jgi:stringent starvation protein B